MEGRVFQINIKTQVPYQKRLPKTPVETIRVRKTGLEGDYNNYRTKKLSNDPDRAILLLPLEMIKQLNDEGWHVNPGDIGENITSEGLDYEVFSPESKYQLGDAIIEITKPCVPCRNLATLPYIGQEKLKKFIQTLMNRRGWFAKVIKDGIVCKGDIIKK